MNTSPDLSAFTSRLHLRGHLVFDSALRVGAARTTAVDQPDSPVLRDAAGRPYVPGSSLKGALRSYTESLLRTLQIHPGIEDRNLACMSVGKPMQRPKNDAEDHLCLTQGEVSVLKRVAPDRWHTDEDVSDVLRARLPNPEELAADLCAKSEEAVLDGVLRDLSCWTCRLFGSPWLASKVLIRDLPLTVDFAERTEIRDGVGIDRDTGRAAAGLKYQFEVVPVGAAFDLDLLVENASPAELGVLWLGLRGFEQGYVLMGGAKSRGLGRCTLKVDWRMSEHVTADTLFDSLFPSDQQEGVGESLQDEPRRWMAAFVEAVGAEQSTPAS
jgi:CRISPR-associated RAMP protein (TIGR02581 family)